MKISDLPYPLLISGPCSVETEEQFFTTISGLIDLGRISIFRGGIWKPRTRPGSFEGIGEEGLKWMQQAKIKFGIPFVVEVANKIQVELALKYDIDFLWIGARTTVNPFSVQEIAECLEGTNKPIFIKNPINADLSLWVGAVERFEKLGLSNLGLIHRGFNTIGNLDFRNPPLWHLALEMKIKFPHYKMICDPSHICGKRSTLLEVSQNALNLEYDGLMIESHYDPDQAWSDANQQVTPKELGLLLDKLRFIKFPSMFSDVNLVIDLNKKELSQIDNELLYLLSKRLEIMKNLSGTLKDKIIDENTKLSDSSYFARFKCYGLSLGLSEQYLQDFFLSLYREFNSINEF